MSSSSKNKKLVHGFPLASRFTGSKKNFEVRMTSVAGHATILGATRSGKTARLINPTIQMFPTMEVKPSMIISDPKGELFETHSKHLKASGYEVLPINLRDEEKSMNWNPLSRIWKMWFEHDYEKEKYKCERSRDKAQELLSALASVIFPDDGGKDKIWSQGASSIFQFMILAMLEVAPHDKEITIDKFNIFNVSVNLNSSSFEDLKTLAQFLKDLSRLEKRNSPALIVGGRNIDGAEVTVNGMVQNAIVALNVYTNAKIKKITSSTSFKIDDSIPQAFFLIVPDEDKSKNGFISLFVSETYKELIEIAMNNEDNKLKRPLYYLLDEFGNIPKIPNLDGMVTVSASRSIYFLFVLQSYKQIEKIYGREDASVILGNCAYEFYLLTNEYETAEAFSKKLGEKEISTSSVSTSSSERGTNTSRSTSSRTRRLLDPNELMKLKDGEMVTRLQRDNPIRSNLAPFWEYPKFVRGEADLKYTKLEGGFDEKFTHNYVAWLLNLLEEKKKDKEKAEKEKHSKQQSVDKLDPLSIKEDKRKKTLSKTTPDEVEEDSTNTEDSSGSLDL